MVFYNDMEWIENLDTENNEEAKFEVVDKILVRRIKPNEDTEMYAIQTNIPITSLDNQYFEIKIRKNKNYDSRIAFGISSKNINSVVQGWPGTSDNETVFAYHWDGGNIYTEGNCYSGNPESPEHKDVVGCGIDSHGFCYITVNGKRLRQDGKIKAISMEREMVYPFISLGDSDTEIIANFGQKEFIYYCKPTTFWDHWTSQMRQANKEDDKPFMGQCHDLTLISKDEENIPCHRLVLCLRSRVFKQMIESQEDEKINIEGYNASTIKQMLHFLYTDSIEFQEDSTNFELLEMAKEFEVDDLQHVYGESVSNRISMKNVIDYWLKGKRLENKGMRNACATFIKENFDEFKDSEEFQALNSEDKKSSIMLMIDAVTLGADNTMKDKLENLVQTSEE